MSKSDRELSRIDLSPAYKPPRKPKWRDGKSVNGLDTETFSGNVFCISKAGSSGTRTLYDPDGINANELFKFMTSSDLEGKINVFYNLRFDAGAIIKTLLNQDQIDDQAIFSEVKLSDNWKILRIPGKLFSISAGFTFNGYFKRKRTWSFYDASQFVRGSLDSASRQWLGRKKADEEIEIDKFSDRDYRVNKQADISYYCEQDSVLVRDLYDKFSDMAEEAGIPAGFPISTGAMAEQYYRTEFDEKIKWSNKQTAKMGWDSYHGGRFEVIKRGYVGRTVTYDINSAYPYHASELADPYELDWYKTKNVDELRNGEMGFVRAKVTTKDLPIQPFGIKSDKLDKLIFPQLKWTKLTVPQETFIYALDNDMIKDYKILDAYTTIPVPPEQLTRPFSFLQDLYRWRKELERDGQQLMANIIKIVINSVYGKTAQIVKQIREINEDYDLKRYEDVFPAQFLPERVRYKYGTIIKSYKSGRWFNPILASLITARTRLQLLKFIYNNNLEHKTIMLATDSLMFEQPVTVNTSDELGGWDEESSGSTYVVGSGVYEIFNDKYADGYKTKARGFSEYEGEGGKSLYLSTAGIDDPRNNTLSVAQNRPLTDRELLWSARDYSSIAGFNHSIRKISANMDDKRRWANDLTFANLARTSQTSRPLEVRRGKIYNPDEPEFGKIGYVREEHETENRIYDRIRREKIYMRPGFSSQTELYETLGIGKYLQLVTNNDTKLGLDEWADKYDMTTSELIETLDRADIVKDRQALTDRQREAYKHLKDVHETIEIDDEIL